MATVQSVATCQLTHALAKRSATLGGTLPSRETAMTGEPVVSRKSSNSAFSTVALRSSDHAGAKTHAKDASTPLDVCAPTWTRRSGFKGSRLSKPVLRMR